MRLLFTYPALFQHTAARRRLALYNRQKIKRRNTVSTHSRPKAAGTGKLRFAVTAAVSTHSRPKAAGVGGMQKIQSKAVSTHSRPKAAGFSLPVLVLLVSVSTHSRPKAAGFERGSCGAGGIGFNTQPPEGGWAAWLCLSCKTCRFNTQPPEGGWGRGGCRPPFDVCVSTHSRPKAAGCIPTTKQMTYMFQHTAARRRLVPSCVAQWRL